MLDSRPIRSTHPKRGAFAVVLVLALVASLAIACGDAGTEVEPEPDPEPESNAPAGVVLTPPPGATQVNVTLSEFAMGANPASVPAGEVYFLATNSGGEAHEMVLVRTVLAPDALPTDDDGRVPEDDVDMIGEIGPFAPGSDASVTFDLEAGSYVLICNIVEEEADGKTESHYVEGMHATFTVE